MQASDKVFAGSVPELYDTLLVPLIFEVYARDLAARVARFAPQNVLIDPPFEAKDEFERLARGFSDAFAKWPTGGYLIWYPVKSRRATDELARVLTLDAEPDEPEEDDDDGA